MSKSKVDHNLNWSIYFEIDGSSPSNLARIRNNLGISIPRYNVGSRHYQKNGSAMGWQLKIKNKHYSVHRIIWVMVHGSIAQELFIDHLDGNPFNNRIENLSLKTPANNTRNSKKREDNTTGITGVVLLTDKYGRLYYVASWYKLNGSRSYKRFSVDKLGEATAKSLAADYRNQQLCQLIKEGADYTERHGL